MAGPVARFKWSDFAVRWLFVFALQVATYNPTGYHYIDWLLEPDPGLFPVKVFVGVALLIVHIFVIALALRTLTPIGVFSAVVFFSGFSWAAYSLGIRLPSGSLTILWVQVAFTTAVTGGMSLALFRQHISGQVTPVEEGGRHA
ncbi:DUF6524 family protein [Azospirillum halopraeferens]|uniref:DUF6524 family protein n=1 Tax=Azospirillum halopraeferens TaxID=34010 RepID=UPI000409110C|nr:DUF6524 family protein [Azospirillum halopraeferens]